MNTLLLPAPNPCGSCPYRRDVPSAVWARSEYDKLPLYDLETAEQPSAVFLCHQQNKHLCAGWVAVHDMKESLSIRFAISFGLLSAQSLEIIDNYSTTVPLFSSGTKAATHGKRRITMPGKKAMKTVEKLLRRREITRQNK